MEPSRPATDQTQIVELTPRGRAALAVLSVTGPAAVERVARHFAPAGGRALADTPAGRIVYGRWGGAAGEELIVCPRASDAVEIHCHGGGAAVAAIVDALTADGCRVARWRDVLLDADESPLRTAARIALAEAPTARTAAVLLDQFHGALESAIGGALAAVAAKAWQQAADQLDALLRWRDLGPHLTRPWRVVLAGPPNVGKSSLKNALVGYERAIVCDVSGTTRDVVATSIAIDGWPVALADTAGLHRGATDLEAAGVRQAVAALAEADLVLVVHDAARLAGGDVAETDESTVLQVPGDLPALQVLNKIDLVDREPPVGPGTPRWDVLTSAKTGAGIAELVAAVSRHLVPAAPEAGAAVPCTAEQIAALVAARAAVDQRDGAAASAALQSLLA